MIISRMAKKGKKKRKWVRRVRKDKKLRTLRKIVPEVLKRIKQRIKVLQTMKELVNWMFLRTSLLRYVSEH